MATVEFIANDQRAKIETAFELIREVASGTDPRAVDDKIWLSFSPDARTFFEALGFSRALVAGQVRRETGVLKRQAIAGTTADREKVQDRLLESESHLATDGPKLRREIEQRQEKLDALEQAVTSAASELKTRLAAVEVLRAFCPPHVVEQHRLASAELKVRRRNGEHITEDDQQRVDGILSYYSR